MEAVSRYKAPQSQTAGSGFFCGGIMDEELFHEAAQFVRDNPDSFRNAVLWFEGGGFDSLSDAWEMATVSCDWDKILLIVSQCVSENGEDIDTEKAYYVMFLGSYRTSKHPSHLIIENALREAKQAVKQRPDDLITFGVAFVEFCVSRSTLNRYIKDGRLKSYRPPNATTNSKHLISRKEIARLRERY